MNQTVAEITDATPRTDREEYVTGANDVGFRVVNPALCRLIERENRRLRSSLSGMLELIESFEDVSWTRDLPSFEAEAIYESEISNAKLVLKEIPL